MSEIQELDISRVIPNPDQPRKTFDPVKLQELADSIRQHGLQQPIKVAPRGDMFLIVMGERRWRAHQLAGLMTIKAIVEPHTDEEIDALACIENEQRADVNPMEMVQAWDKYMRRNEWSVEMLAEKLGRKKREVKDLLRLLDLADPLKPLVARGQLSVTQGMRLGGLKKAQQIFAVQVLQEHRLSALEFEELCRRIEREGHELTALFDLDAFLAQVEQRRATGKRERVRRQLLAELSADELLREVARRGLAAEGEGAGAESRAVERNPAEPVDCAYAIPLRGRVLFERYAPKSLTYALL